MIFACSRYRFQNQRARVEDCGGLPVTRPHLNGGARHFETTIKSNEVVISTPVSSLRVLNCVVHSRLFSGAQRINCIHRGFQQDRCLKVDYSRDTWPGTLLLSFDPPFRERSFWSRQSAAIGEKISGNSGRWFSRVTNYTQMIQSRG